LPCLYPHDQLHAFSSPAFQARARSACSIEPSLFSSSQRAPLHSDNQIPTQNMRAPRTEPTRPTAVLAQASTDNPRTLSREIPISTTRPCHPLLPTNAPPIFYGRKLKLLPHLLVFRQLRLPKPRLLPLLYHRSSNHQHLLLLPYHKSLSPYPTPTRLILLRNFQPTPFKSPMWSLLSFFVVHTFIRLESQPIYC
jgi:hypothetical protein